MMLVRTFVYGMPSSGATFVAWTMSQSPRTIGLLDICRTQIPEVGDLPPGRDVVLKDNPARRRGYSESLRRFRPDRVVMVSRDPDAIRESLTRRYRAANQPNLFLPGGLEAIDDGFRRFDAAMSLRRHDSVVEYEDVADGDQALERPLLDIAVQNHLRCRWCRPNTHPARWGLGGLRVPGATRGELKLLTMVVRYYGKALDGGRRGLKLFKAARLHLPPLLT